MDSNFLFKESISVLKKTRIPSAELDTRIIFEFVLDLSTEDFFKKDFLVSKAQENKIKKLIYHRAKKEPIAYLINRQEFFGIDFFVNKNVLIPRPESEWLVEKSIKYLESSIKYKKKINIIDIGTGSGNIIISIIKHLNNQTIEQCNFSASDISQKALNVAEKNMQKNHVNILLYKSDLFTRIPKQKFDLIIANLPYVPENAIDESVKFEPKNAIFARDNGAEIIKRFLVEAKDYLNIDGKILIELDPRNAEDIKSFARKIYPNFGIEIEKDLANFSRYLTISY